MKVLHHRHSMVVLDDDVVLLAPLELDEAQLRLLPMNAVLRRGVADAEFPFPLLPFDPGPLVRRQSFTGEPVVPARFDEYAVPALEDLFFLIVYDAQIGIVKAGFPRFVFPEKGIAFVFLDDPDG